MNVLLILGHPRKDSFCAALFDAYYQGARQAGATLRTLVLADLEFDPHVRAESPEQQFLEPAVQRSCELIEWADHLVFVYPTWWGNVPALLKGFLDRVVMPGFGFRFKDPDTLAWEKLWQGKTAQIITTMDTPPVIYRWFYRKPGHNAMSRSTLGFCGARTRRGLMFGPVRLSTPEQRRVWLERSRRAGFRVRGGPVSRACGRVRYWLQALRLQFYPMSWAAYTIGALAVAGNDVFQSAVYWWGYLCLFCLEAATVFANDYFDYKSDERNAAAGPFNGGSRVLVDQRLSFADMRAGIVLTLVMAVASGIFALNLTANPGPASGILVVALVTTLGYTVPPLKLCYRGLGEFDVGLTHSLVVLLIGYVLLGGFWRDLLPWLLALPLGLSILPAIILSGLPDRNADASTGKRTLVVKLGSRGSVAAAGGAAIAAASLALLEAHLPQTRVIYGGIVWGIIPHVGLLVLVLFRLLRCHSEPANRRIDGTMVVALTYILWFVVVPFWNLI